MEYVSDHIEFLEYYGIKLRPGHMLLLRNLRREDEVVFVSGFNYSRRYHGDIIAINDDMVEVCSDFVEREKESVHKHASFDDGKDERREEIHLFYEEQERKRQALKDGEEED